MLTVEKPLNSLYASDLMSHDVVMIPEEMSLQGAARLLSRAQVSGGPVVDNNGKCIGVLSAVDYLHWAEHGGVTEQRPCPCSDTAWKPWQMLDKPEHSETLVGSVMNRNPVTASPKTTVGKLAQMMLDAHIHRVVIVDPDDKPVGIVSSTDILAALAHADAIREVQHAWTN
jgi:CBS domain-containing protein